MDFDYRLLAKYLTGMLSPEEMKQVEEWRELSIDNDYCSALYFHAIEPGTLSVKETKK